MNVGFTQVLLARANREWEWPTGDTEHRPVFQPSWFHETKGSEGFSLQQGEHYSIKCKRGHSKDHGVHHQRGPMERLQRSLCHYLLSCDYMKMGQTKNKNDPASHFNWRYLLSLWLHLLKISFIHNRFKITWRKSQKMVKYVSRSKMSSSNVVLCNQLLKVKDIQFRATKIEQFFWLIDQETGWFSTQYLSGNWLK